MTWLKSMGEARQTSAVGALRDMLLADAFQTAVHYDRWVYNCENRHWFTQFMFITLTTPRVTILNINSRLAIMKDWLELTINKACYLDVPDVSAKVCEVIEILVPSILQARDDHERAKAALVAHDTHHREWEAQVPWQQQM